jgi:hypothetical protein
MMDVDAPNERLREYEGQVEAFLERIRGAMINNLEIGLDAYARSLAKSVNGAEEEPIHRQGGAEAGLSDKDKAHIQQLRSVATKRINKYFPTFSQFAKDRLFMPSPALVNTVFDFEVLNNFCGCRRILSLSCLRDIMPHHSQTLNRLKSRLEPLIRRLRRLLKKFELPKSKMK